ncbi:hypothetical protein Sjap_017601 [Stephania japonica]|uniref:Uncharacterized protein n=1 Tax=Stephania japonica TaxID=461633 RepID=A0AAP0NM63_9MAGN
MVLIESTNLLKILKCWNFTLAVRILIDPSKAQQLKKLDVIVKALNGLILTWMLMRWNI